MKEIKRWISDYFGFAPKETKGFIVFSILIVLVVITPFFVKYHMEGNEETFYASNNLNSMDSIIHVLQRNTEVKKHDNSEEKWEIILTRFNPNVAGKEDLLLLGFKPYAIANIIKYREKGGSFKTKADLKRIYGIDESFYQTLSPYIDLPEQAPTVLVKNTPIQKAANPEYKTFKKERKTFDINEADSLDLIALSGIGEKLAKRILAYRTKLGGFVEKYQFAEVYGLDSIALYSLEMYGNIHPDFVPAKININRSSVDELKNHPYISYKLANIIVSYRKQHGDFKNMEELKNIKILNESEFKKVLPYLEL